MYIGVPYVQSGLKFARKSKSCHSEGFRGLPLRVIEIQGHLEAIHHFSYLSGVDALHPTHSCWLSKHRAGEIEFSSTLMRNLAYVAGKSSDGFASLPQKQRQFLMDKNEIQQLSQGIGRRTSWLSKFAVNS